MLPYLLKSAACMTILLLFYKLLLEKENMHIFKRFYLLGAVITSLIIPSIVFVNYVEPAILPNLENISLSYEASSSVTINEPATDIDMINWSLILWTVYSIGLVGFGFRFFNHLFQIIKRIRTNPKYKDSFITRILLLEKLPPHTFFNFIFLNKSDYESKQIPDEVLLHEETHAKQKHSLDVLFIELLQVILWFNPFVYLFKKCIKLNHEFLADSAVLKRNIPTSNYQNTLLSYLSQDSLQKYQSLKMANAINYSSIKKRFKIMKTHTSKQSILLRSFLVLPLFVLLLYGFSETKVIEKEIKINTSIEIQKHLVDAQNEASKEEVNEYNTLAKKYNEMDSSYMRILLSDVNRLKYIYNLMTDKQKATAEPFPDFPEPPPAPEAPMVLKEKREDESSKSPKDIKDAVSKIPAPPLPPKPSSPLDLAIKFAKKDAIFYYEGKKVTSDKAIDLLKKNKNLNMNASNSNGNRPIVKISKAPIVTEN